MKINRRSWHYRLLNLYSVYPEHNLCPYVRQVIGHIIITLVIVILLLGAASIAIGPLAQFFVANGFGWALSGGLLDIFLLAIILTSLVKERRRKDQIANPEKYFAKYQAKEPGLFRLWLRAQHDKICPRIDFSEG